MVVSSTSAGGFVLEQEGVHGTLGARRGRPLFLIDLAVPRDLDPAIHELPGATCTTSTTCRPSSRRVSRAGGRRRRARRRSSPTRPSGFCAWQASLDVVPAIASLRARAEEIRSGELARARLGGLSEQDRRAVESLTAQIVSKLLHLPTVRMKEAAAGAEGGVYADVVRDLFGLEDDAGQNRLPRE